MMMMMNQPLIGNNSVILLHALLICAQLSGALIHIQIFTRIPKLLAEPQYSKVLLDLSLG